MKLFGLLFLTALLTFPSQAAWGQSDCDPSVKGDEDHPEGYRQRGDRCEGLYWHPHALEGSLSVVGFRRMAPMDWSSLPDSVRVAWKKSAPIPPKAEVSVKGVLLRSDMYYRMDANKTYSMGAFDWPTDVLRALHLDFKDLGLFAATSVRIGGAMWQVYLPLEIGLPQVGSSTYELTMVPGTALADLSWQYSKVGSDGLPTKALNGEKLKRSFPAAEPIRLQIPVPKNEGYFYVEINADALSPNVTEPLHADFAFFASR
jgi:hypothetical protein